MSQTLKEEEKKDAAVPVTGDVKIRWDYEKMKSTYSNVCNVASTREEFTLLFGTNQSWHEGQKELVVELTDRIVLNPYAAKRLSIVLSRVVASYEATFGELQIEAERKGPAKKI